MLRKYRSNSKLPLATLFALSHLGLLGAAFIALSVWSCLAIGTECLSGRGMWATLFGEPDRFIGLIAVAALVLLCGLLAWPAACIALLWRRPGVHKYLHKGFIAGYLGLACLCLGLVQTCRAVGDYSLAAGTATQIEVFFWYVQVLALPACSALALVIGHWQCLRVDSFRRFGRLLDSQATGDARIDNVRNFGSDPQFRKSWMSSAGVHLACVILPFLFVGKGCVEPYVLIDGAGDVPPPQVVVVKPVEEQRVLLAKDSWVSFNRPDLDTSEVVKQTREQSERIYESEASDGRGAGWGSHGTNNGWPTGLPGGKLRFIRLLHNGSDWDDGMHASSGQADGNFLRRIGKINGVKFPVADSGEAHRAALLTDYPTGYAPPFVYLTGSGGIGMGSADVKALRKYLTEEGGMLFADAGAPGFHASLRNLVERQLFPGKTLVRISKDDQLFRFPYSLPDGVDPLWHHGGSEALGIKYKGRWVVFYHPGDVNDAWKDSAIRLRAAVRKRAFQVGFNVVSYAIRNYVERHMDGSD